MRPGNGEAPNNGATNTFGKDAEISRDTYSSDGHDTTSETSEKQAGVKRIEAVSKNWTKTSLIIAYVTYAFLTVLWTMKLTTLVQASSYRKYYIP
jgi:SP family sugar:H+ symporter-like MFS transporter